MYEYLQENLAKSRQNALYRSRQIHTSPQTPLLCIDGREYLAFCSNDYLGMASHPQLNLALQQGVKDYAVGSGASHLITGHTEAHHALEQALADYTGRERALLFSTGYMANIGTLTALLTRHDAIFLDKLNHASIVDAALLCRAQLHRYPHNDMAALATLLANSTARHKLIVTDGVFSMDGDVAPLPQMVKLAQQHDAWIMVDDAHGLGVLGVTGRGVQELFDLSVDDIPVLMGTLGKAFGVFGAFVAGRAVVIESLIQAARSYIYTTALPPALASATLTSLELVQTEVWRREKLRQLIFYFRDTAARLGIELLDSFTPIQPLVLGDSERALMVSNALFERGILVTAIRPPTVPVGTARLRITLSALHETAQVDRVLEALAEVM